MMNNLDTYTDSEAASTARAASPCDLADGSLAEPENVTSLPPGPRLPSVLQGLSYLLAEKSTVDLATRRYGEIFTTRMPSLGNVVVISNPALVRQIFTVGETYLEVGEAQQPLEVVYGPTSVLLSDGAEHRRLRKLLVPPLRPGAVAHYREIVERTTARMLSSLPLGKPFPMLDQMRALSCDVILQVVLGIRDPQERERWSRPFRRMLHFAGSEQMTIRYCMRSLGGLSTWSSFQRARAECDSLLYGEIARRRAVPDENANDILTLLLRSGQLDDRTLRDQLMTLIVGGHETPAGALAWAFERLVRHPAALERLTAEAIQGDEDSYAEAVVQETLRVRPPLSFVARRVTKPFRLGSHTLPPGTTIVPYFSLIHHRPDLYERPSEFLPERFLGAHPPAYGWVPFGGGAHACLGGHFAYLEIKTVLHTVLRGAVFDTVAGSDEPIVRKTITYVPKRGARVVLRARR
jgi:cytochrome P450